jgi:hypothetical protein
MALETDCGLQLVDDAGAGRWRLGDGRFDNLRDPAWKRSIGRVEEGLPLVVERLTYWLLKSLFVLCVRGIDG